MRDVELDGAGGELRRACGWGGSWVDEPIAFVPGLKIEAFRVWVVTRAAVSWEAASRDVCVVALEPVLRIEDHVSRR